jgi:AcrR family transcriptional regulator
VSNVNMSSSSRKSQKKSPGKSEDRKAAGYHHGDLKAALVRETVRMLAAGKGADLSLRDLGQRLGVSHSAVYRHFPDREALLAQVAEEGFRLFGAALDEAEAACAGKGAEAVLMAKGEAYVAFAAASPAHFGVMFEGCKPQAPLSLQEAGASAYESLRRSVAACADEGLLKGGRAKVDEGALVCWSIVHGVATLGLAGLLPGPPAQWARAACRALGAGIIFEKGRRG